MISARSFLYALIFYPATLGFVLAGLAASVVGKGPMLAVIIRWSRFHYWLSTRLLRIRTRLVGRIPHGAYLIAVKHQSMYETLEMVRLAHLPVIVLKRELSDLPLFGWLTRRYGVIPVDRSAGAKALREMVAAGQAAVATGRPILIFPEGTRVTVGQSPELRSGFAGLYRALGVPIVPVAVDSGHLWGKGLAKQPGTITFQVGETIPAGLGREVVERRVHSAINALELAAQASA